MSWWLIGWAALIVLFLVALLVDVLRQKFGAKDTMLDAPPSGGFD